MNSKEIIEQYNSAVVSSYGRLDLALESGRGAQGRDADGLTLIDFGSGIGTNSLGYADSEWADAVSAQAHKVQHVSNYYYNSTAAEFTKCSMFPITTTIPPPRNLPQSSPK